jgi:hypothetical protein
MKACWCQAQWRSAEGEHSVICDKNFLVCLTCFSRLCVSLRLGRKL